MIDHKKILAIIPARGGSKGVPRKNLRTINHQSLLAITIKSALSSKWIDRVVVSSDDDEILAEAKKNGADVPFVRPKSLAEDHTPGIDPVLHALSCLPEFDYVVLLQVTSPLRTIDDIDNCITYFHQSKAPACVSLTVPSKHPHLMFNLNEQKEIRPLFSGKLAACRQDLPPVYAVNGAIYVAQCDWLKTNKTFIADETVGFLMPEDRSIDIDTEIDFLLAEAILKAQPQKEYADL